MGKLVTLGKINLVSEHKKGEAMSETEGEILTLYEVTSYLKAGTERSVAWHGSTKSRPSSREGRLVKNRIKSTKGQSEDHR